MAERETKVGEPLLVSAKEAAKMFRVGESTLRRWAAKGLLPSVKLGYLRKYRLEDIERAIREGLK